MSAETTHTAEAIVERIFDVSRWTDFTGYGPIPGIRSVAVEPGPDGRTATRFFVTNTDGSQHRETVIDYQPGRRLVLRMDGFSAPLRHLAEHFIETWEFGQAGEATRLVRSFELQPRNPAGALVLRVIGYFLKKAIRTHTQALAAAP